MKQDNNMENELRWMENNDQANLAHVDQHWQQMRSLLQPASYSVKKGFYSRSMVSKVIAGLVILGAVVLISRYENDKAGKGDSIVQIEQPNSNNSKTTQPQLANIPLVKATITKTALTKLIFL